MIEKVQESHLYMWLKEKDSKFFNKNITLQEE